MLIITLLKSESSTAERNFEKLFNNNTDDDDTYDDKIRGNISDIRMILIGRIFFFSIIMFTQKIK